MSLCDGLDSGVWLDTKSERCRTFTRGGGHLLVEAGMGFDEVDGVRTVFSLRDGRDLRWAVRARTWAGETTEWDFGPAGLRELSMVTTGKGERLMFMDTLAYGFTAIEGHCRKRPSTIAITTDEYQQIEVSALKETAKRGYRVTAPDIIGEIVRGTHPPLNAIEKK